MSAFGGKADIDRTCAGMSLVDRFRGLSNLYGRSQRVCFGAQSSEPSDNGRTSRTVAAGNRLPVLALGFVILAAVVGPNVAAPASPLSGVLSAAMIAIMLGAVFAAVEFADVIAHRVGEPYGTVSRASAGELFGVNTIDSISATSITVTARVSTSVREPAPSRAGISGFGREPVYQCSRRALCPNVDLAELHLNNCRPLL